jgi:hypothetical protein
LAHQLRAELAIDATRAGETFHDIAIDSPRVLSLTDMKVELLTAQST